MNEMIMKCNQLKNHMERYRDNALLTKEKTECEEHLAACADCRQAFADFKEMKLFFTGVSLPPVPADLTAAIMRNVRNSRTFEIKRDGNILIQWWKESVAPVRLAFSALLIIFAVGGFFVGKDLWNTSPAGDAPLYAELETFSESQQGSLENSYFQLIQPFMQRGK
jgi:predicted anti-sigma-YlaC factor YlaD